MPSAPGDLKGRNEEIAHLTFSLFITAAAMESASLEEFIIGHVWKHPPAYHQVPRLTVSDCDIWNGLGPY
ncbi:hypothetical protein JYU34_015101 [Plutella xylostella]|uniref:Uncharacterized protein n=1 Tax=Plutella xylostella TaxID=51655 RepID=A0ABQ7Q6A8_PLUXY|nr:hypothetical protein JYU34_015101 [Plutella xylostella]